MIFSFICFASVYYNDDKVTHFIFCIFKMHNVYMHCPRYFKKPNYPQGEITPLQNQRATKTRMQKQNVCHMKEWKCVSLDSRACCRHKRTSGTEHKETETEMDRGSGRERNSPCRGLEATGRAAFSPAHERCDCLTTSLSQESSPSGGQRPLYLPGLQGYWEKPRAGYVRYHAGAGGGDGGGMRCKKAAFQCVL